MSTARERRSAMGLLSGELALPTWTLSEVEEALLERMRATLSYTERSSSPKSEEEGPCWWMLSALNRCDGKEAREAYYAKL
jgi:hypothetical protein